MPREAAGQVPAAFQVDQHVLQHLAQCDIVRRCNQAFDTAQQRNAGAGNRVHLP
jgi:hypothetical protein